MLARLAFRSAKRSIRDYSIYLITVTIAFSIIYAFNKLSFSEEIRAISKLFESFIYINISCSIVIVLIIGWLINYMVRFMFERRGKEFGTYMILGIDNKSISKMFFFENSILGLISLVLGIFIGTLLFHILSAVIMNVFEISYEINMTFSWKAMLLTVIYAIIIFFFSLLGNLIKLRKMKIHDLIYSEKKNESNIIKKNKGNIVILIISIIMGIFGLLFLRFIFVKNNNLISALNIIICFLCVIICIYGTYISLSPMIIKIFLNKKRKYSGDKIFLSRSISSKINTMSFTLGTLALLIFLTLVAFQLGIIFKCFFDKKSSDFAPFDISITNDNADSDFGVYINQIEQNEKVEDKYIYSVLISDSQSIKNILKNTLLDSYFEADLFIKYSDYTNLRYMLGYQAVSLDNDKYILHCINGVKDLVEDKELNINVGEASLTCQQICTESFSLEGINGAYYVVIIPDEYETYAQLYHKVLVVKTQNPTTVATYNYLDEIYQAAIDTDGNSFIYAKGAIVDENRSTIIMISFSLFYLGLIFACVATTIISVQQLSDSTRYRFRYRILSKLGMTDIKISKLVFSLLLLYFIIPLLLPIPISISIILSFCQLFMSYLGKAATFLYIIIAIISFLGIYLIYFIASLVSYIKNINAETR